MIVTATEFKSNLGKYLDMVATQDVYIRLTSPSSNKLAVLDELVGVASQSADMDEDTVRKERLARQ